jgi:hypothetical protein
MRGLDLNVLQRIDRAAAVAGISLSCRHVADLLRPLAGAALARTTPPRVALRQKQGARSTIKTVSTEPLSTEKLSNRPYPVLAWTKHPNRKCRAWHIVKMSDDTTIEVLAIDPEDALRKAEGPQGGVA